MVVGCSDDENGGGDGDGPTPSSWKVLPLHLSLPREGEGWVGQLGRMLVMVSTVFPTGTLLIWG